MKEQFSLDDTIASYASFPSKAAVGVIKISGRDSLKIISRIFRPKRKKDIRKVKTYTLHYGWIIERPKGRVIDEVLVGLMRAPFSYTREDVVEIYSHSGQLVLSKILDLVLREGARLAQPGEFTKRAFLHGRIDLSQAEAILDIVEAKSEKALEVGVSQLRGGLSNLLIEIENILQDLCSKLEAELSFPEDVEIEERSLLADIKKVEVKIKNLLESSQEGRFLREGVLSVICGRTNVGKSSLLNMLLKEERVIVTPLPGTTRDAVEEDISIRGLPLKIYDTAGILEPRDLVEKKALESSLRKIEEADLILLVFDGSQKLTDEDYFLIKKTKKKKVIFVINKIDLSQKIEEDTLRKCKKPIVKISALLSRGLKDLEKKILRTILKKGLDKKEGIFLSNIRHINLLKEALNFICQARDDFKEGYSSEFSFFSLRSALEKIYQIRGKVFSEEILKSIFSNFCIGK